MFLMNSEVMNESEVSEKRAVLSAHNFSYSDGTFVKLWQEKVLGSNL